MCLYLKGKTIINRKLLGEPNSKGLYSGYKFFYKDTLTDIASPFYPHTWERGWNVSSRLNKKLNVTEKMDKIVYAGFHIFVNRADALQESKSRTSGIIIRKVWFKLEDVVATGVYTYYDNVVVMKLYARFD